MTSSSRWKEIPSDIIRLQFDYLKTPKDIEAFCGDSYIYEKFCQDENGSFWQYLFHRDFSNDIKLRKGETVKSQYLADTTNFMKLKNDNNILRLASKLGYEKIILKLNLKKISLEILEDVFYRAIESGSLSTVKIFYELGLDFELPLLTWALYAENMSIINYFIEQGEHLTYHEYANLLTQFVLIENLPMIKYVIENRDIFLSKDTIIHEQDAENEAFIQAVGRGFLPIVKYLLDLGVDIHFQKEKALREAVLYRQNPMALFLIDNGSDVLVALQESERLKDHFYVISFLRKYLRSKVPKSKNKESVSDISTKCMGITKTGKPCTRNASDGSPYCFQHIKY